MPGFSGSLCEERRFREAGKDYLPQPVKCPRPETGTLFPHRRMYKHRMNAGIIVPVSTWEFSLF
jgi:hypothetical protein